jgi:hypothetical protein
MSLLNPNQIRHFGLVVSDDPTDKACILGIVGNNFIAPFEMSGTTVLFKSRVPTQWEVENYRIVELTAHAPWDPSEVTIACVNTPLYETFDEVTHRLISALSNRLPRLNDDNDCCSDLSIYEATRMIQRMTSSVHVATGHRDDVFIAYVGAKDRHSRVTPDTVAMKFRCEQPREP